MHGLAFGSALRVTLQKDERLNAGPPVVLRLSTFGDFIVLDHAGECDAVLTPFVDTTFLFEYWDHALTLNLHFAPMRICKWLLIFWVSTGLWRTSMLLSYSNGKTLVFS